MPSTRAIDLLRNNFGVSQLYKYEVKADGETLFSVYWHPLTIAEREAIQSKSKTDDTTDFALSLMVEKALDVKGKRLFQEGDRPALRREVDAGVLQEIQLEMLNSGATNKVEEAKADMKSEE